MPIGKWHFAVKLFQRGMHLKSGLRAVSELVRVIERSVPESENCIANELVDGTFIPDQNIAHRGEKAGEEVDHLMRLILLRYP